MKIGGLCFDKVVITCEIYKANKPLTTRKWGLYKIINQALAE